VLRLRWTAQMLTFTFPNDGRQSRAAIRRGNLFERGCFCASNQGIELPRFIHGPMACNSTPAPYPLHD
jgi:hypothetical protein